MRRLRFIIPLSALLMVLPAFAWIASRGSLAAIPEGFANSQFEQVWSRADSPVASGAVSRSWVWGPTPGQVMSEPFAGAPGGARSVQYFDKARMEVNPAVSDPSSQWSVTTGLLVVEMVSGKVQVGPDSYQTRLPAAIPVAGDGNAANAPTYASFRGVASLPGGPDRRAAQATGSPVLATIDRAGNVGALPSAAVRYTAYSAETGHNIPGVFDSFMQTQGLVSVGGKLQQDRLFDPVYVLGYPITEAYWTTVPVSGQPTQVLVQLYQRRVLTYVPSFPGAWQVQMGNVGQHYYGWRYGTQSSGQSPAPTPAPDSFIRVDGKGLTYQGKPIVLKGTNYWLHTHPFVGTWINWDGPTVRAELDKARQLGVNSIRIGIPYNNQYSMETVWGPGCNQPNAKCDQVKGPIVNEMTQFLQIAAGYNMKVIFTLFDSDGDFPAAGTAKLQRQLNYAQALVAPFANDDRVLAWDLHNEPENYDPWDTGKPGPVIAWVQNVAATVRGIDTHHLITVGLTDYQSVWVTAQGKSITDFVDFVSFHCYNAGGLRTQMDAIRAHTNKPVLLEEMGWPTGPAKLSSAKAVYDEPTQQFLYRTMIGDAKAGALSGLIQWTLQDNPLGTETHYIAPTYESWFGLVRLDGSFKPAAVDFRDSYPAPLLPSVTVTSLPLTVANPKP